MKKVRAARRTAIGGVAGVIALLVVLLGVVAAPAQAADGRFYIWQYPNHFGIKCSWVGDDRDYRYNSGGGGCNMNVNDWASSWHNNGYAGYLEDVNVREHIQYGGADICVPNGRAVANLGGWDNRASSHFWSNNC